MKKERRISLKCKKFQKNPCKQYAKRYRIYPSFLYSHLDRWLKKMSLNGWHVVHCGLICFLFEKGVPEEREYFTYGLGTQEGKYSISLRFPLLEKQYGLEKKKSAINSNCTKAYSIVEIDTYKIDIGYGELINDRNHLYMRYFLRNLSVIIAVIITLCILLCFL